MPWFITAVILPVLAFICGSFIVHRGPVVRAVVVDAAPKGSNVNEPPPLRCHN